MKYLKLFLIVFAFFLLTLTAWAIPALQIQISGVSEPDIQNNIRLALDNLKNSLTRPTTQSTVLYFFHKAPDVIKNAIQPFGYFNARVESQLTKKNGQYLASFHVIPGPVVTVDKLDLQITGEGNTDEDFLQLEANFPIKIGDTLKTQQYEKAKNDLFDIASEKGYFEAKMLVSKIIINLFTHKATIIIHFSTGPRYRFGQTIFSKSALEEAFLRRFLAYDEGDYFSSTKVQETVQHLTSAPYFEQVMVNPMPSAAQNYAVPIHVRLVARKRVIYTFGAGWGSDTGVRGTLGINVLRLNKYGHRINLLLRGSSKNSSFVMSYIVPGLKPWEDYFSLNAGIGTISQANAEARSRRLSLDYVKRYNRWNQIIALTYLNEFYNLPGVPFTNSAVLFPSANWTYSTARNNLSPEKGFYFYLDLSGGPKLGDFSRTSFFEVRVGFKSLFNIFNNATRFLVRSDYAHVSIKNLNELPFSLQLFAGGARSIRGYSFNSIGPGRNLFVGSFEIQQRIKGNWYLAAFYDVGNVTNGNFFSNFRQGVGPGIVWLSPVGVIEVTAANAISQPNHPWLIQFTIGPVL